MLIADATESRQANEPADPIDRTEPADPIDKTEPAEPIDRIEPDEPIDRIEPLDPMLSGDSAPAGRTAGLRSQRMRALSQPLGPSGYPCWLACGARKMP